MRFRLWDEVQCSPVHKNEMITENDIENLQMQILQLLDEKVYKYNGVDSSSIRKEILEDISGNVAVIT